MGGGPLCFLGEAGTSCAGVQAHWTVPFSSWFLQSWMTNVLLVLDDSEPLHSDIFVTDDLELPSLKTEEGNNFGHLATFAIHLLPLGEESCWRWNHMKMNGVLS